MIEQVKVNALRCTCEVKTCKHVWLSLSAVPPTVCASCRSREWNGKKRAGRPPSVALEITMPRPKKLREVTT